MAHLPPFPPFPASRRPPLLLLTGASRPGQIGGSTNSGALTTARSAQFGRGPGRAEPPRGMSCSGRDEADDSSAESWRGLGLTGGRAVLGRLTRVTADEGYSGRGLQRTGATATGGDGATGRVTGGATKGALRR